MDIYTKLVKKKKFIGNQPISLSSETFDKKNKYFVTDKLDGQRHLLMITSSDTWEINSKLEFKKISLNVDTVQLDGTILDCEKYKSKYYVFDILFYKKTDLRTNNLYTRLSILSKIFKSNKEDKLVLKKYYSHPDFKEFIIKYIESRKNKFKPGKLDGIILTPTGNYYDKVLKYKPIELLSIDFKIKKENGDTFLLLTQKDKLLKLKTSSLIDSKKVRPYVTGILKVDKKVYNKYKDSSVVEFIWKNNKFYPIRSRPDKVMSNSDFVIKDNMKLVLNPDKTKIENIFGL